MPFKFKYQSLLKYREDIETQAKHSLAVAINQRDQAAGQLAEQIANAKQHALNHHQAMQTGISAAKLAMHQIEKAYYKDAIISCQQRLNKADQHVISCRQKLLEMTVERKKMEKLKERAIQNFMRDEQQRELLLNDQIITYKASSKRKEDTTWKTSSSPSC